jgi:hypothetical protein
MTSLSKKPVAKKRGRPASSKNKPAAKPKTFKQKEINMLIDDLIDAELLCEKMDKIIEALELKIKNLEHKAMQYEVVIDYLETKLEIK